MRERTLLFPHDRTCQRIHIWALRLLRGSDPCSSGNVRRLTQTNSGLSGCSGTREGRRWRGATVSDQTAEWLCVCVCVCVSETTRPHRDGCQSAWGLMGVRYRDEGMEETMMQRSVWGWRDNRILTAFFFSMTGFFFNPSSLRKKNFLLRIVVDLFGSVVTFLACLFSGGKKNLAKVLGNYTLFLWILTQSKTFFCTFVDSRFLLFRLLPPTFTKTYPSQYQPMLYTSSLLLMTV